ncbi:MAG: lysozyme inhibitor LprI family protein [Pseudomonadota bacterium]
MKTTTISIIMILYSAIATADTEYKWKSECDKNQSTMNSCASEKFKHYDKILNNTYNEQINYLETKIYIQYLRNVQRAWIIFRDADCTYDAGKREDSGSIWPLQHYNCLAERTKTRIIELKSYLKCRQNGCNY